MIKNKNMIFSTFKGNCIGKQFYEQIKKIKRIMQNNSTTKLKSNIAY